MLNVSLVIAAEPWHEYLALPGAPLVLAAQATAFAVERRWLQLLISAVGVVAVTTLLVAALVVGGVAQSDANIGAGLLLFGLAGSVAMCVEVARRPTKRSSEPLPPPGWYPDPVHAESNRYWNGYEWTPWTHAAETLADQLRPGSDPESSH